MHDRIILDLCGGTGAWSQPYVEAGYDVRVVTLPEQDVQSYTPPPEVHGILAAPPCTEFAVSGARWWAEKPAILLQEAIEIVRACLVVIETANPAWWALENPVGRLPLLFPDELGPASMFFHPYEHGDAYTKKTGLWGDFAVFGPSRMVVPQRVCAQGSWIQKLGGSSERTKALRSATPPGFARAFFEANP